MSALITLDMLHSASSADFPVIDLGGYMQGEAGALARVAEQLRYALENIGFLIVVNHGIAPELTDGIVEQARRFHAQPMSEKLKLATAGGRGSGFTGYLPPGEYSVKTSEVNDNNQPDLNEAFFMDRERAPNDPEMLAGRLFREPNKWPDNLPGFRDFLLGYWEALERFSQKLLPIFATALDLPSEYFDRAFVDAQCVLRLSHFPPTRYREISSGWRPTPTRISSRSCRRPMSRGCTSARRVGSGSRRRASPARSSSMPAICASAGRMTGFYRRSISRSI